MIEFEVRVTNISLTNSYAIPNPNPNPTPSEGFNITLQPINTESGNQVPIILYSETANLTIGETYTLTIS
jgi:hypothetical protein